MTNKIMHRTKHFIIFATLLLCTFLGYLLYGILRLPDEINITVGHEMTMEFAVPVSMRLEPEAVSVMNQDGADIESKALTGNKLDVDASETGSMDLELSFLGVPLKKIKVDILPEMEVVPCGKTVGVKINAKGLMVLGMGSITSRDGQTHRPADGKIKKGDIILTVNGVELNSSEELNSAVEASDSNVSLEILRDGREMTVDVKAVQDEKQQYKLGLYLRDGTTGIGTMTYYNPETRIFGALGHGIMDVDTKKLITVKTGKIMESSITTIRKGKKGSPGELEGDINKNITLGEIRANTPLGLYGIVGGDTSLLPSENEKVKVGLQSEVHEGPAVILSNISGTEVKKYDIYIENVNKFSSDEGKGMVIRITDKELLTKTNGIVQGMSGSPILQDNKLVGAVTHVFVQNPAKGYGIFIENMFNQEKRVNAA